MVKGFILSHRHIFYWKQQNKRPQLEADEYKKDGYRQQNVRQRQKLISIIGLSISAPL